MQTDDTAQIGEVVKLFLALHAMDQQDLAAAVGMDPTALSRSIKGRRKWQTIELRAIAGHFNLSFDVLFGEPDDLRRQTQESARTQPGRSSAWVTADDSRELVTAS